MTQTKHHTWIWSISIWPHMLFDSTQVITMYLVLDNIFWFQILIPFNSRWFIGVHFDCMSPMLHRLCNRYCWLPSLKLTRVHSWMQEFIQQGLPIRECFKNVLKNEGLLCLGWTWTAIFNDLNPCQWQTARFITLESFKLHKNLIF